ncbi:MAG: hypothetical protein KBC96_11775 [Armatimonadetes bacterium]|nr:hypothetical protein [Armatimonadota bacterium]
MSSEHEYASIPEELKARPQWVCYRIEQRNGKPTKVPYQAGRRRAKSNDPSTWHSFPDVVEAAGKRGNRFDGVGFMLSEADPYVFIDLDHVVSDGVIEDWGEKLIAKADSYSEFSRSGSGIHIMVRARKPGGRCRTHEFPKFEIYENARLVVFTGKLCPGSSQEIKEAQSVVNEIYWQVFGHDLPAQPSDQLAGARRAADLSDCELIQKAMSSSNGDKFGRLWNGDTSDYGGDHSVADMALCCMLSFWTGHSGVRIDKVFRQSGLMRDKWDEKHGDKTYGEMTVEAAIRETSEAYHGSSERMARRMPKKNEQEGARDRIAQAKTVGTAAAVFAVVDSLALLDIGEYADTVRQLKEAIPQLDMRELKGAVTKARRSQRPGATSGLPELFVGNRQLREMGDEAIRLLEASNVPPVLFVRSGLLCRMVEDEQGRPAIGLVTEDIILARLAKVCDIVVEAEAGRRNALPHKSLASYILSEANWPFPALEAITRSPTVRPDGSIAQLPGYDPVTKLFYQQASGSVVPNVAENPTPAERSSAIALIDELLHDFPFDCQASKANAIALLLSPILQPAIADLIPLALIDAPAAGTGKSLLALVAGIISSGAIPDFTGAPTKEDEWPKKITAILSAGPSLVVIDNVKCTLKSGDLARLLTSRTWKERIFGKNTETVVLPNRATWIATGNNIQLGGDIPRRCVWIRIDAGVAKPHERDSFLHPCLEQWVTENRGRLLSALLTLCRSWYAAGRPEYPTRAFGSFGEWTRTVGGVLAHAGIKGFLQNRDQLWEQSDTESTEWEAFLANWLDVYGSQPITPKELVSDIEAERPVAESVPVSIADAVHGKGDRWSRIGYQFKARLGRRYGPRGLRLEKGPQRRNGNTWLVAVDDHCGGTSTNSRHLRPQDPDSDSADVEGCGR